MPRRSILSYAALYLFATAFFALLAFLLGLARVEPAPAAASWADFAPRAAVDTTDAIWDCEGFGDFGGLRTIDRVKPCGPGRNAKWTPPAHFGARRVGGPLQRASASRIAEPLLGGDHDGGRLLPPGPQPLSLALGPDGGGPDIVPDLVPGLPPPSVGDFPGLPPILIDGAPPPPDSEVPLPGAAVLFLAGLAILRLSRARP